MGQRWPAPIGQFGQFRPDCPRCTIGLVQFNDNGPVYHGQRPASNSVKQSPKGTLGWQKNGKDCRLSTAVGRGSTSVYLIIVNNGPVLFTVASRCTTSLVLHVGVVRRRVHTVPPLLRALNCPNGVRSGPCTTLYGVSSSRWRTVYNVVVARSRRPGGWCTTPSVVPRWRCSASVGTVWPSLVRVRQNEDHRRCRGLMFGTV